MITRFNSIVYKANKRGAGFIRLPTDIFTEQDIGRRLIVNIYGLSEPIKLNVKICSYLRIGFYVPAAICNKHSLLSTEVSFTCDTLDGFQINVGYDGRIYLPNEIGKNLGLRHDDILEIQGDFDGTIVRDFCQVKIREKSNTIEYKCTFNPKYAYKTGIFKIVRNLSSEKTVVLQSPIFSRFNCGDIGNNSVVVFDNKKQPVVIEKNIDLFGLGYYLGCFFADGTKKGNNWGIVASTFEQCLFFHKMHFSLVKNPTCTYEISFSNKDLGKDMNTIKKELQAIWKDNALVNIPLEKIRIRNIGLSNSHKWNEFGSLVIKENKKIVQILYNVLLGELFKEMKVCNNSFAWNFICGVLEGDGCCSSLTRGHLSIATNKAEGQLLLDVFKVLGLSHEGYREGENKYTFRIGALEILLNLTYLHRIMFQYYPKRRRIFIERFLHTGAARYILGKQDSTSGWVKRYLLEKGVLDSSFKLTVKGENIKSALLQMEDELVK